MSVDQTGLGSTAVEEEPGEIEVRQQGMRVFRITAETKRRRPIRREIYKKKKNNKRRRRVAGSVKVLHERDTPKSPSQTDRPASER